MSERTVMTAEDLADFFGENGVACRVIVPEYGERFIAVFSIGSMTQAEIASHVRENGLLCIFFRDDEKRFYENKLIP